MDESVVPAALVSVEKMKIFLYQQNTNCPSEVLDVVEKAKNCLEILQAYLRDSRDQVADGSSLKNDGTWCVQMARKIEDTLDEFMVELIRDRYLLHTNKLPLKIGVRGQSMRRLPLKIPVQEVSLKLSFYIEITVSLIKAISPKQKKGDPKVEDIAGTRLRSIRSSDLLSNKTLGEDEAVGFEKLKEELIEQLMEQDPSFSTIGIVGMGGCGKTTLAKMVYDSIPVSYHFDCQAWVDASHPLRYNDILIGVLGQFEGEESANTDKRVKLIQVLDGKKFLVVLDGIWRCQDLSDIQHALSKAGVEGSRVVITTRNSDIASVSAKYIHDLTGGLSDDGAMRLFCKKAFHNSDGKPPDVLEKWSEKFVKVCEGLPLAISTLGTWLANTPQHPRDWEKQYEYLGPRLCDNYPHLSVLSHNLQLSYRDLPSHLKSCFLYLSMFPEDYSVSRETLLRLWVAEGFVMPERRITVEQVAEDYLNELIGRNLAVATAREGNGAGRVRRCRVLHLVRRINISREKSFTTVLDQNYKPYRTGENIIRRVSYVGGPLVDIKVITGCVRSFLMFEKASSLPELQIFLRTSRYLKVLDLNGADLSKFPRSIVALSLLRYLSLRHTQIEHIPNSIGKLRFMETLDLKYTLVRELPKGIRKLEWLRHLLVSGKNERNGGVAISARSIGALTSMQKLSFIKVETNRRILKALLELTDLRKLGLTDVKTEYGVELCGLFKKMQNLSTLDVRSSNDQEFLDLDHMDKSLEAPLYLRHLYLRGRLERVPQWIPKLDSLTKIGLKYSQLEAPVNPLKAIQGLPNLLELDLVNFYTGESLEFEAETFPRLAKLNIQQFEKLTSVVILEGAMPSLTSLSMCKCEKLENVPAGIDGLLCLREFRLDTMPYELIDKLQKSEESQLVKHYKVILSYKKKNPTPEDLSPSKWHLESNRF